MTNKKTPAAKAPTENQLDANPQEIRVEETPFEALASICSVLVIGLFILTFLAQNFLIPSGSMENTLLVGDHLVVDRITLTPNAIWMPLIHYREPKHNDIIVFYKPATDPDPVTGAPTYLILVKRLIGLPGDHIHLRDGIVYINGVAQTPPKDLKDMQALAGEKVYLDDFPSIPPAQDTSGGVTEEWAVESAGDIVNGDLIVPPGKYFMMGDNRHNSLDSRYWGFVPRENIVGRPLFNYWSIKTTEEQYEQTGFANNIAWIGHLIVHFFPDTRWSRTFHKVQ